MKYLLLSCWPWKPRSYQAIYALAIPLGYPSEFDVKMILLKTLHDLDVRCREVKMEVNQRPPPCWLDHKAGMCCIGCWINDNNLPSCEPSEHSTSWQDSSTTIIGIRIHPLLAFVACSTEGNTGLVL